MATLIENVNRIYTDKENIKQAIINKGITVPDGTSLDDYADLISQINGGVDTSTVTATADDVLEGKVIVDADGNPLTGTMKNYGGVDILPKATASPSHIASVVAELGASGGGYYGVVSLHPNFEGYVNPDTTINQAVYGLNPNVVKAGHLIGAYDASGGVPEGAYTVGTYTSDADAEDSDILSGKTAYVNGIKRTGNISRKGEATYTPTRRNQIIASGQYLSGEQIIKGDSNLVAANIVSGKSIFGVSGTAKSAYVFTGTLEGLFGSSTLTDGKTYTFTHSLGITPNYVIIYISGAAVANSSGGSCIVSLPLIISSTSSSSVFGLDNSSSYYIKLGMIRISDYSSTAISIHTSGSLSFDKSTVNIYIG